MAKKEDIGVSQYWQISTPSGKCPADLKSTKMKDVRAWMDTINKKCLEKKEIISEEAYLYYLRYFHSIFSDEYKDAAKQVEKYSERKINEAYKELNIERN